jgi:hypothetical protein
MIAPVLARNRDKIFLAGKSDARDYEGFKRDLNPDFCGIAMVRNDVFKRFNQDGLAHAQVSMQVVEVGKHVYFFGPDTIWSCDVVRPSWV